jgi:divalent metal cation (Fe/Co/Zn/Cd) transporter
MTTFFEYLTKDGGVLSTAVILLGVAVIIASGLVLSGYNILLMIVGIFVGVIIIIIGGKYSKFKKEEN